MDTRQLRTFVTVVERGSFSQAAEVLGVTQPAVSLAIRALEARLGERLLDRSGRRVEPTQAGVAVLGRAQRMLALELELTDAVRAQADTLTGRLEVGASTGPGARLVPRLLVAFRRAYPAVEVAMRIDATQTVVDRVVARELEIGIVGAERPGRNLVFESFCADEIVLALPGGHPAAGTQVSIQELLAMPIVVQQEGSGVRSTVERALRAAGVRPRDLDVVAELGLQESVATAVEEGLGVTFTSRAAIERELKLGVLAEARVEGLDVRRNYVVVRSSAREPSRLTQSFLTFARGQPGMQE